MSRFLSNSQRGSSSAEEPSDQLKLDTRERKGSAESRAGSKEQLASGGHLSGGPVTGSVIKQVCGFGFVHFEFSCQGLTGGGSDHQVQLGCPTPHGALSEWPERSGTGGRWVETQRCMVVWWLKLMTVKLPAEDDQKIISEKQAPLLKQIVKKGIITSFVLDYV